MRCYPNFTAPPALFSARHRVAGRKPLQTIDGAQIVTQTTRAQNSKIIMRLLVRGFANWAFSKSILRHLGAPLLKAAKFRFTGEDWLSWGVCCGLVIQVLLAYRIHVGGLTVNPH
jgi:hypothetical protein